MDIKQTLSNMGRKISEAKLPYIWDWRQYDMPTYDWDYNLVKWNPIFWPATWTSAFVWEVAPILFADNAIDTIANWLPNVYNWAVDEYNAWASKRALNNYINNEWKEAREKIQRRQNQATSAPAARRILQTIPNNATAWQTQQVVAQNNEALWRMEEAKKLVTNELKRMNAAWELTKDISRTKKLIDLYKKLK